MDSKITKIIKEANLLINSNVYLPHQLKTDLKRKDLSMGVEQPLAVEVPNDLRVKRVVI